MLSAIRKSDGQTVNAYFESKANAPFYCLVCGDEVALKTGRNRVNHFAHVNPLTCRYTETFNVSFQYPLRRHAILTGELFDAAKLVETRRFYRSKAMN